MDKSHARQPRNGDGEMSETLAEQYGLPTHVVHKPPSPSFTFASDVVLDIVCPPFFNLIAAGSSVCRAPRARVDMWTVSDLRLDLVCQYSHWATCGLKGTNGGGGGSSGCRVVIPSGGGGRGLSGVAVPDRGRLDVRSGWSALLEPSLRLLDLTPTLGLRGLQLVRCRLKKPSRFWRDCKYKC